MKEMVCANCKSDKLDTKTISANYNRREHTYLCMDCNTVNLFVWEWTLTKHEMVED